VAKLAGHLKGSEAGLAHFHSEDAIQRALERCVTEPIHIPGAIQPLGALFAVDQNLTIRSASKNIDVFLRVAPQLLLDRRVPQVFSRETRHELSNCVRKTGATHGSQDLGTLPFGDQLLSVTASPSGALTLFEIERAQSVPDAGDRTLKDLDMLFRQVRGATSEPGLFQAATTILRALTGYDRVMVYVFEEDGHGTVQAESAAPGVDSFLGLRFPAWDIPEQARALMCKLPFRYVYDVSAPQVPLLCHELVPSEIDLTYSHLRASSPVHLVYLQNMGVRASFTLHIMVDETLWGMISFHHRTPRYPSTRVRQLCRHFADVFTLQLRNFQTSRDLMRLNRPNDVQKALAQHAASDHAIEGRHLAQLSDAMAADGAALVHKQSLTVFGKSPAPQTITALAGQWVTNEDLRQTSNIARDGPEFAGEMLPEFGGLLAITLEHDFTLLLFREARDRTLRWAGDPMKEIKDIDGVATLTPRDSFKEHLQEISGTSAPWTPEQMRMAKDLQVMLSAQDRADLLSRTNALLADLDEETSEHFAQLRDFVESFAQNASDAPRSGLRLMAGPAIPLAQGAKRLQDETPPGASPNRRGTTVPGFERRTDRFANIRCLVLDENRSEASKTERILKVLGVGHVKTATRRADALALIEVFKPNCAVLEIQRCDAEVWERITNRLTQLSIPIICVAGHDVAAAPDDQYRNGIALTGPVTEASLRDALARVFP